MGAHFSPLELIPQSPGLHPKSGLRHGFGLPWCGGFLANLGRPVPVFDFCAQLRQIFVPVFKRKSSIVALLAALCCASCASETAPVDTQPDASIPDPECNGHEELCGRRFDQVVYPMTHNAMSNAAAGWILSNQNFGITRQLEDGIRGMMLDTYEEEGELLLCHVICPAGSQPLVEGLREIADFLATHPDEVVSIIFENYITHAQTASAFEETGLLDLVYAHPLGEPWPTLGALIDSDTRLVVFQEKLPEEAEFPWLMNVWDHTWETPFFAATVEDLSCTPNRGDPDNPLFLLNHFLTGTLGGLPELADMVNYNPLFLDRARECEEEGSALPNFVAVDFYDAGDLFEVVDALNGL